MKHMMRVTWAATQAALLFTVVYFAVTLAFSRMLPPNPLPAVATASIVAAFVVSSVPGIWWLYSRLRRFLSKTYAAGAAFVFAACSPLSLGFSLLLSQIVGGNAAALAAEQPGAVAFAAALAWVVSVISLVGSTVLYVLLHGALRAAATPSKSES
jgi:hypothetical protein